MRRGGGLRLEAETSVISRVAQHEDPIEAGGAQAFEAASDKAALRDRDEGEHAGGIPLQASHERPQVLVGKKTRG
jgi:hypothetical protein